MIIKSLDLEHFGKFHHQKFELGPKVNIIYGGNEAGKSTIHRFIHAMLFGLKRGRGKGAANDEYTRCQPWENGRAYEGLMVIEHDGHTYRIYRNFYKEDEVFRVFDEDSGQQIFLDASELESIISGLNETNFRNTVSVRQHGHRIDDNFASVLQTYMANISMGKDETVDIGAAFLDLTDQERTIKRQMKGNQIIGIRDEIEALTKSLEESQEIREKIDELHKDEMALMENILKCQEDMKLFQTKERRERMEGRALIEQYQMTSKLFHEAHEKNQMLENSSKHYFMCQTGFKIFIWMTFAALVMMALQIGLKLDMLLLKSITALMMVGAVFGLARTSFKKPHFEPDYDEADLNEQLKQMTIKLSPYIRKYGRDMMGPGELERTTALFNELIARKDEVVREKAQYVSRQERMDECEARLSMLKEEEAEILEKSKKYEDELRALSLAKQVIGEVSSEIHDTFGHHMNDEAQKIFEKIIGQDAKRAFYIDEKLNICMDGLKQQIPLDRLSAGTIDQLYFALRFCAGKLIFSGKSMPLILDDTLAYYDDERLKNFIDWLIRNYSGQIIFFTCHHREANLMDELGYDYNYICL